MTTPEAKYTKYNDSKVYKIQFDDKYFYIGSTVQNLSSRFSGHKRDCQKDSKKNITLYNHTNNNGGWGNAKIILIEKFCLNDKSELIQEEDRYIQANFDSPLCLNMKFYNKSLQRDVTKTLIDNTDNKEYNKYNNSKIYRLFSDDGYFYYGSTSENIKERLRTHIKTSKMPVYRDSKVYKYFNEFGWNNVKIETVSEHLFETKKQLMDEENKYIDKYINDPKCLNTRRSVMLDEERRKAKTRNCCAPCESTLAPSSATGCDFANCTASDTVTKTSPLSLLDFSPLDLVAST